MNKSETKHNNKHLLLPDNSDDLLEKARVFCGSGCQRKQLHTVYLALKECLKSDKLALVKHINQFEHETEILSDNVHEIVH